MNSSSDLNPLILVVEDDEDTRLLLRTLLEMRGMRVVEELDGKSGLRAAEEIHPDLILMDLTLPTLDGLAATRLIRERATLRHVPVVITSGHADPRAKEAAFAAGCSYYLVKPVDFDQLDCILLKYLTSKSLRSSGRGLIPSRKN
ncbi:response regulator [soil metagenome]